MAKTERVIKFRCWEKDVKKMSRRLKLSEIRGLGVSYFDDQVIWMQFTGLHDKNGKEIYEGDILLTNEGGWVAEVTYYRDGFYCRDRKGGFSTQCEYEEFEVIGNIYENPELLKKDL